MKTMRRIDQPLHFEELLQFEEPLVLTNSLLDIQHHYQQIVRHIGYFNKILVEERKKVADVFLRRARQRTKDAVRRARGHEKPLQFMSPSDESDQELPTKRQRNAPYRFNIASTKGAFYQK